MPVTRELRDFYASIDLARVKRFVDERQQENHLLDFKTIGLKTDWSRLTKEEKDNLAHSLSGFANTGGGVLVWGVGASKDAEGIDAATEVRPFPDPDRVLSVLEEQTSVAVTPIVAGVEHELIWDGEQAFAKTLVPQSDWGPHRAEYGERRYYLRSGSSFVVMEHQTLADMFGRRPHPDLTLETRVIPTDKANTVQHFRIQLGLRNNGRGIALYPALFVTWEPKDTYTCPGSVYEASKPGLPKRQARSRDFDLEFVGGANDPIHHGTYLPVVGFASKVSLSAVGPAIRARQALPVFQYRVQIHCADAPLKDCTDTLEPECALRQLGLPFWSGGLPGEQASEDRDDSLGTAGE